jgi:1-acyl-sn-glycerol-3-phosphate acyltransferase
MSESNQLIIHRGWTYRLIVASIRVVTWFYYPFRVEGFENLPKTGGAVISANHASFLDIPAIAHATSPRHISFVARDSLAKTSWLAVVMRNCGAVLIERGASDRRAFRAIGEHLKAGDLVGLFPEGTRSTDGNLLEFKKGAVMSAKLAHVPLIPCGLVGLHRAWGRGRRFPRPARVIARFGSPIDASAPDALEQLKRAVSELMREDT